MRSTVPRMRTVSCANAGSENEARAKLEAASTRRNFSIMTDSGGCMHNVLATPARWQYSRRQRNNAAASRPAAALSPQRQLFDDFGANLANGCILITRAAAATDCANQLA